MTHSFPTRLSADLDDQRTTLAADSQRHGSQGEALDYALLVDGLEAEREQGITIDVAYRYFGTARRKFIVADCPGHEQYTRNMATGASSADLAVRSEEHTSELQSLMRISYAVFCLKKQNKNTKNTTIQDTTKQ